MTVVSVEGQLWALCDGSKCGGSGTSVHLEIDFDIYKYYKIITIYYITESS